MQPDPSAEAVAARIRAVLGELNVSGAELARRVGVTQSYMARRLLVKPKAPFTVTDLMSIARVLGVDVARFLPTTDRFPWDSASDAVLANEAALDPDDHSRGAEYVREVAGSVRDHRAAQVSRSA